MGKNTLLVGLVVMALVVGVIWWLGRRKTTTGTFAPPQVKSTSGTGGLKAGIGSAATAACAIVLTAKGAGAAAPACALVGPVAGDVFSTGLSEAGKALKSGFGLW